MIFLLGLVLSGFARELPPARAASPPCAGAPITLTPEHFERPLCVFVRSLQCPQSAGSNAPNCNFRFDYPGSDGRFHPISGDSLFRLLPPDVPVLILVHGSFVDFEEEPELLKTFEWIRAGEPDKPLLVLCYRWPSTAGWKVILGSVAVCELAQRAEFNGFYLAQLINRVPAENPVRLMGHSHGCRMICSALHLLSGGEVDRMRLRPNEWSNRGMRAIFFSAAMDHDWLNPGRCYGLAMNRLGWLLNQTHCLDWALLTYPFRYPGSSRALGQTGFTRKDLRLLGPQAAKIQQFNGGEGVLLWGHGLKSHLKEPGVRQRVHALIYAP